MSQARSLTPKRVAYPSDDAVPAALFRGWIIDEYAIHDTVATITAVVPYSILTNAGHHKEVRRNLFVDDAGRRMFLSQEDGRRIVRGVGNGLHSEIGTIVIREKSPACPPLGKTAIPAEYRDWHVHAGSSTRDHVAAPFCVTGTGNLGANIKTLTTSK